MQGQIFFGALNSNLDHLAWDRSEMPVQGY